MKTILKILYIAIKGSGVKFYCLRDFFLTNNLVKLYFILTRDAYQVDKKTQKDYFNIQWRTHVHKQFEI